VVGRFVVVDGNSGTGKTTVATHLRDRMDATVFHYPESFVRFRDEARLDSAVGAEARLHYYLGATLHLSELVQAALATGRNVVCDRYLAAPLSLLVAEEALPAERVEAAAGPLTERIGSANVTLHLVARHEVAVARLHERLRARLGASVTAVERQTLTSPEFFYRREAALRRYASLAGPVVDIDTSSLDPDEMCRTAWRTVRTHLVT
jgi:thymidylate kinase